MSADGPRLLDVRGIDLCVQEFGAASDPAVLLIAGAQSSMDLWDERLCARIAEGGRRVIRYDQRDTGQSYSDPPGSPAYTFEDLLEDATGILDVLGVDAAHVVGISMGGGAAQLLALDHPARVASLTLLSTSPAVPTGAPLPGAEPQIAASFASPPPDPDWHDRDAVVAHVVGALRLYAGDGFDERAARELCGRIFDRTRDVEASQKNHYRLADPEPARERPGLGEIRAPTLVVHGTRDPLFPLEHGEALARAIPGARLLALPGVGHEPPPPGSWDVFVPALLDLGAR